ncbi:hypothetical protein Tco_0353828, partial [Tanacetum coccineum]
TGEGGDSGKGIWGGDKDHGDSGDAGGEDIITPYVFSSLTTSINPQCTFCIVRVCFKS